MEVAWTQLLAYVDGTFSIGQEDVDVDYCYFVTIWKL